MLRCRAGSRGKSTERRPSPDTDPNKRNSSAGNRHGNATRILETHTVEDNRQLGRKQSGQGSPLIVGNSRRHPWGRPEGNSGEKQLPQQNLWGDSGSGSRPKL